MTRRDAGLTMTIALMALVAVVAAGTALSASTHRNARQTVAVRDRLAALYAAEAGVERARWAIGRDPSWSAETMRFDAFDVTLRVTPLADGRRSVRAVAAGSSSRASISATLACGPSLAIEAWREE